MNDKKLDGISDLRDESNREGIRVVRGPTTPSILQYSHMLCLPIIESRA